MATSDDPISPTLGPQVRSQVAGDDATTRRELELALRAAHVTIAELRDDLHALAAQVVALTERTQAHLMAVPTTADSPPASSFEKEVAERTEVLRRELAIADERSIGRVALSFSSDKYQIPSDGGPPCHELLPICQARCCTFAVALSTQDLDEGRLRWDYATPYWLAKSASHMCVHHTGSGCEAYDHRPAICRTYDCRSDARVWADYDARVLAPVGTMRPVTRERLDSSALERKQAFFVEASRLRRR